VRATEDLWVLAIAAGLNSVVMFVLDLSRILEWFEIGEAAGRASQKLIGDEADEL
jgi:DNA-binding ferritin-like protein (Dps family)